MTFDLAPISRFLDGMVHDSAADDRLSLLRHRYFIAAHLGVALLALSAFPVWLAFVGPTSAFEALTFAWIVAPLAIAGYLSKSGRLEVAHLASAVAFAGLIVWVAGLTGGVHSMILVWLALVPFEASLSGSRRVVAASVAIVAFGLAGLLGVSALVVLLHGAEVTHNPAASATLILAAVIYAGSLAIRVEGLARESARAARRGEDRYRLLADHSTDMITRHGDGGDVEFASPAVRALTGATSADVLGDGLFRRVHVADRPTYLRALSEAYSSRQAVTAEFRLLQSNVAAAAGEGSRFIDVEMRCRPALDSAGRVSAVVAVTRDISALKQRENELREAQETADRANRAKTQFLAHMSHELRTPLNAIIGFSEILKGDAENELYVERRREYAALIHTSGEHLLQVVNGILDMSKIESGMFDIMPERVALVPLVAGCCDMMGRQAADRAVAVIRAVPADLPEIAADRRACRQILLNLLSNAIKFTDRGGTVTVGARIEGTMVAIFVRDTGIGIAAEDLPRLGTPFVQAETVYSRHYEGTGLGLSMVKGLAALHGGRLTIESKPGVGTTATVLLPVEQADGRPAASIFGQSVPPERTQKERKSA
jgi:cell cycle sensor histidine kinase DivJ